MAREYEFFDLTDWTSDSSTPPPSPPTPSSPPPPSSPPSKHRASSSRKKSSSASSSRKKSPSAMKQKNIAGPSSNVIELERDEEGARQKAIEAMTKPKYSFVVTMKQHYVDGDCRLQLPFEHGEKFLSGYKDTIISLRCQRASWPVMVRFSEGQYRLGHGWRDLVQTLNVEMQDACLFELMRGTTDPLIYSVRIFKA